MRSAFSLSSTFMILWIPLISSRSLLFSKLKCPNLRASPPASLRCSISPIISGACHGLGYFSPSCITCFISTEAHLSPSCLSSSSVRFLWSPLPLAWHLTTQNNLVITWKHGLQPMAVSPSVVSACTFFGVLFQPFLISSLTIYLQLLLMQHCTPGQNKTSEGSRVASEELCTAGICPLLHELVSCEWEHKQRGMFKVVDPFKTLEPNCRWLLICLYFYSPLRLLGKKKNPSFSAKTCLYLSG